MTECSTLLSGAAGIAHAHDHDALVLSAFGCGAFGNPPSDIARLFAEVLGEPEFAQAFKGISFAIIDDQNGTFAPLPAFACGPKNVSSVSVSSAAGREHNPDGNYAPFVQQFAGGSK